MYEYPPRTAGGDATGALIAAILMTLCCNQICGVIAIVFSAIAMGNNDPYEQERYVRYAWTTMKIGLAIMVVVAVLYFLLIGGLAVV